MGHLDIVKFLVVNGEDINTKTDTGNSLLMVAVVQDPPDPDVIKFLVDYGADVNAAAGNDACTVLMLAVFEGKLDLVKFLVAKGANVNARDLFGRTPLWHAKKNNKRDVAAFLEQQGAK